MHKYKNHHNQLTSDATYAKNMIHRICKLLSKKSGRRFYVTMNCYNDVYEGHIVDTGKCIDNPDPSNGEYFLLADNGDTIGTIFFGGFYSRKKHKDAESNAWISLLEDCIGQSCDEDIRECHNLTKALGCFGPHLDFNCKDFKELEKKLTNYEMEI